MGCIAVPEEIYLCTIGSTNVLATQEKNCWKCSSKSRDKQLTSVVTLSAHTPFLIQVQRWGTSSSYQGASAFQAGLLVRFANKRELA
ncbi:hypothetical protein NIES2130_19275 [Scytonema sp. HK-05]|nr:hypothetical protein NIES2130_19275 [Scytonema sp. HK-05]